jgi:hypothetical protein
VLVTAAVTASTSQAAARQSSSSDSSVHFRVIDPESNGASDKPSDSSSGGAFDLDLPSPRRSSASPEMAPIGESDHSDNISDESGEFFGATILSLDPVISSGKQSDLEPFTVSSHIHASSAGSNVSSSKPAPRVSFKLEGLGGTGSMPASNDLDLSDTASSAAALSMSLPVEIRLKQYAERHQTLSLSLSTDQADLLGRYFAEVDNNSDGQYNELNAEETAVLAVILPTMVGVERTQVREIVAKELTLSTQDSVVVRISENIVRFLGT